MGEKSIFFEVGFVVFDGYVTFEEVGGFQSMVSSYIHLQGFWILFWCVLAATFPEITPDEREGVGDCFVQEVQKWPSRGKRLVAQCILIHPNWPTVHSSATNRLCLNLIQRSTVSASLMFWI